MRMRCSARTTDSQTNTAKVFRMHKRTSHMMHKRRGNLEEMVSYRISFSALVEKDFLPWEHFSGHMVLINQPINQPIK